MKLKYIESKIAYPDFIYDNAEMNKLYADVIKILKYKIRFNKMINLYFNSISLLIMTFLGTHLNLHKSMLKRI